MVTAYIPTDDDEIEQAEQASLEADVPGIVGRMIGASEATQGMIETEPVVGLVDMLSRDEIEIPSLEPMSEEDLKAHTVAQLNSSLDGLDGELVGNWRLALAYYKGPRSDDVTAYADVETATSCVGENGRANVASMDIADVIESLMAQIMPSFEGSTIFRFGAKGSTEQELKQDETRAEEESEYVNRVLMAENNGYIALQSAFRDALLMRVGYLKITTRDEIDVESQEYDGLTSTDAIAIAMQDPNIEIRRLGDSERYVAIRYTKTTKTYVEPVPQEEIKLSNGWHSPFLDGIPFIAHTRIVRRSDLVEMGFDAELVDQIPTESQESNQVSVERSTHTAENQYYDALPGSEPVRYQECYIKIDFDGDGFAEQRRVCLGGDDVLLRNETVPEQPFVSAVPILRSHRATGISLFDRLRDIADSKAEAINQHIDNLRWCNQPDIDIIENQANLIDLLARRPGSVNRKRTGDAITRNAPIQIGDDALRLIDYLDKMRSERGGASLDLQSAQMQISGDTAHGVERQISARELMASFIASTLVGTGLVPAAKKIHRELRRNPRQEAFRADGRAMVIDTSQWTARDTVEVTSAITLGDQMRRQQALGGIFGIQQQLMDKGQAGELTSQKGIHNTLMDIARVAKLANPSQYWVDPASPEAQQARMQKQQAQQEQMQAQQAQQQAQHQQQAQLMLALEQMRQETARMREQARVMMEQARLAQKERTDAANLMEDGRQANQDAAIKLTEMNAEYDKEPVPDTIKQVQ